MFQNNIKIAVRGYLRNASFTSLNLLSLMVGLLVAYIAIAYLRHELSYDAFHQNADQLYRVANKYRSQDYSIQGFPNSDSITTDHQLAQIVQLKNTNVVVNAVQFITSEASDYLECDNKRIAQKDFLTTNTPAAFVEMFTWKPLWGSLQNFGEGFGKVMLTASVAEKLFGTNDWNDAVLAQKSIKIGTENYQLAAIIEDVPTTSHIGFTVALNKPLIDYWGSRVYIQIENTANTAAAEQQINAAMKAINPHFCTDPLYKGHYLQAIRQIHLHSNILYEMKPPGNIRYLLLVGFFALFIVLITLFNYANLSLAIQSRKGKAVGVRKVLGAKRFAVAQQFLSESILLALLAVPLVVALIPAIVPQFNQLMEVDIPFQLFETPQQIAGLTALAALIGMLAGVAPALYVPFKNTLYLLKDQLNGSRYRSSTLRKVLVINQFTILIVISAVSWLVSKQIDFIESKDLGFQKEGIILAYTSPEKQNLFQEKLRQIPGISAVGNGSAFGITSFNQMTYKLLGNEEVFDDAQQLYLDYEAIKAYRLKTSLEPSVLEQTGSRPPIVLINRTAAEKLAAVKQVSVVDLMGTTVITEPEYVADNGQAGFPFAISGIFEDINLFSLHEKIKPHFITVSPKVRLDGRSIIALDGANDPAVMEQISAVYASLNESFPLEITALSDNIAQLHQQDSRTAQLLSCFNFIAVLLAMVGIAGITRFMVAARTKEIGIRKILGALPTAIFGLVLREYIYLIGLAFVLGCPIAYYLTQRWLSDFAYRIEISGGVFVAIGGFTFLVTSIIVGMVCFRAALANPVQSLRSE